MTQATERQAAYIRDLVNSVDLSTPHAVLSLNVTVAFAYPGHSTGARGNYPGEYDDIQMRKALVARFESWRSQFDPTSLTKEQASLFLDAATRGVYRKEAPGILRGWVRLETGGDVDRIDEMFASIVEEHDEADWPNVVRGELSIDELTDEEQAQAFVLLSELLELTRLPRLRSFRIIPGWKNGINYEYSHISLGIGMVRAEVTETAREHTVAIFDSPLEALIRHEFGHYFQQYYEDELYDLLPYRADWEQAYGVTERARESWYECIAENFALWSARMEIHDELAQAFQILTEKEVTA